MQRILYAAITSFLIAMVLGPVVIPWLKRMKFGQTVYELGPQSHQAKQGIPTMGGIIFALPAAVVPFVFSYAESRWNFLPAALIAMIGFAVIGFVDDRIKIRRKRNLGLTPLQKIVPQIVFAALLSVWAYRMPGVGSRLIIPFTTMEWDLGWAYIPVMTFILVGTVNSANLLDGLDGLLAGCAMIDFFTMALICLSLCAGGVGGDMGNTAVFCGACAGALLGYLHYNAHPASVFMGDVGSFAIGGALAGVMLLTRLSLLLPVIALAMMMSSVSDIIQIGYFKFTHGKRVFKMAPVHHHFELSGMPETKIVTMYMLVTAALCLLSLLSFVPAN